MIRLPKLPDLAACYGSDPEAWFPVEDGTGAESTKMAKRVCMRCPVKDDCLREAMDRKEPHGVWGEMTTKERNRLRKRRALR